MTINLHTAMMLSGALKHASCGWVRPLALVATLSTLSGLVLAQDDGQSVKVGEADLFPSLQLGYLFNSNAFVTENNEVDTNGFSVSPSLLLKAERRLLTLEFSYDGDYATFDENALDFDDHDLQLRGNAELSSRRRFQGGLRITKEHEDLGRGFTRGIADADADQVEFLTTDLNGAFTYGARNAQGNVTFGLGITDRSFKSRSDLTDGQDFTRITPSGEFTYKLSDRSRALFEFGVSNWNFTEENRDRNDIFVNTGLVFSDTGKSGGTIRVGATRLQFDESVREDTTELTADIQLFYSPIPQSRFDLTLSRAIDDLEGGEVTVDSGQGVIDDIRLNWSHEWSGRVSSRAFVSLSSSDRSCPTPDTDSVSSGFQLGVDIRRWLEIGAGFIFDSRTADDCPEMTFSEGLEFDRERANIFIRATL